MKAEKVYIDQNDAEAKKALEDASTTLITMKVILHDESGLGLAFECDAATVEAINTFMPEGWLIRFMKRLAAAVADNKKMYKVLRDGTNKIIKGFDRVRPDLEQSHGQE